VIFNVNVPSSPPKFTHTEAMTERCNLSLQNINRGANRRQSPSSHHSVHMTVCTLLVICHTPCCLRPHPQHLNDVNSQLANDGPKLVSCRPHEIMQPRQSCILISFSKP
jgi:hypothetical protein